MCLFGTGVGHCDGWFGGMLSSVMVDVRELMLDEGRCGAMGRERAIVAIMIQGVVVGGGPQLTGIDAYRPIGPSRWVCLLKKSNSSNM